VAGAVGDDVIETGTDSYRLTPTIRSRDEAAK
jgi:hypothetical protein